jgi:hypothetical protein
MNVSAMKKCRLPPRFLAFHHLTSATIASIQQRSLAACQHLYMRGGIIISTCKLAYRLCGVRACVKRWRVGFSMRWRPRAGCGDQLVHAGVSYLTILLLHAGSLAGRRALGEIGLWIFVQQPFAAITLVHGV